MTSYILKQEAWFYFWVEADSPEEAIELVEIGEAEADWEHCEWGDIAYCEEDR